MKYQRPISSRTLIFGLCLVLLPVFAQAEPFRIGMILPLSGPAADYGQSIANSVELARQMEPRLFDNIEMLSEDAAHDPTKALTAFRKLTDRERVDLVYTWGVSFCKALAPISEAKKIPLVGQCIDQESSAGRKYVLRFMNYTDEYLRVQSRYLAQRGYTKLALLLSDHPYLEEMYRALRRNLQPGQTLTLVDQYPIAETNLRSSVSKLKNATFDAVGVFLYAGQISQFYKQAREQKLELPTFGTNFFESSSEVDLAAGTMEGAVFANNIVTSEFSDRYRRQYGNTSQLGFGALGFEFALATGRLFNHLERKLSAEEIIERFRQMETVAGKAAGDYRFTSSVVAGQYFQFPIEIKEVGGVSFQTPRQLWVSAVSEAEETSEGENASEVGEANSSETSNLELSRLSTSKMP